MNLPESTTLTAYDESGGAANSSSSDKEKRPKLRIIKLKKKKNVGEVDLNEIKKKKANKWKIKKDEIKKMVKLDLLMPREKSKKVYDQDRIVPREIHEFQDNTDDELFLKLESGSVSTINSKASSRSKFENKLRNTKDKYMKYQTKAINKIKSFIPATRSSENLKFMTASDISKSRTLVAETRSNRSGTNQKPPRPPAPKNYHSSGRGGLLKLDNLIVPATSDKPPIRPARRKSRRSVSSLNSSITATTVKTSLPASVYYRQLREKWLEKHGSKSNLSSICSGSLANCTERKLSFLTNQSMLSDDFRYRYRADFHQSNQQLNSSAAERQSIKSEPTYAIVEGLPPKAPLRKRLTVSSYLSGSSYSLHRKLNPDYFNPNTDKSEQATEPLFWKPFSFKTHRVRSLTELYIRKNQSPSNSTPDHLDRRIDELNQIYCMPKRLPLPVRYKKRQLPNNNVSTNSSCTQLQSEPIYYSQMNSAGRQMSGNYLRPVQYTNLHEVYTVRDAIVGPNTASYGEKEIQTSLEDFHDIEYEDDEYETSPRFIDSSTNDEFESLAKTRNLSDNENSEMRIKKQIKENLENLNMLNELKHQQEALRREIEEEIKQRERQAEQKLIKEREQKMIKEREQKVIEEKRIKDAQQLIVDQQIREELKAFEDELMRNEQKIIENKQTKQEPKIFEDQLMKNEQKITENQLTGEKGEDQQVKNEEKIIESLLVRDETKPMETHQPKDEKPFEENLIQQISEPALNDEATLTDEATLNDDYVTVQESSTSRTIGPYLDAHQGNTLTVDDDEDDKKESTYLTLDYEQDPFDTDTLADLDSLGDASLTAGYLTPMNGNSSSSLNNTIPRSKPKRTKRRSQLRNSGLDTEDDDEDDITDEIIGIAANLQKELKQLVDKQD